MPKKNVIVFPSEEKTKVIFRVDKETGETIAFFPRIPGTIAYLQDCLCYQRVGQHGTATFNYYLLSTRPAKPEEYKDLQAELESIGYTLERATRFTSVDMRCRRRQITGH